MEIPGILYGNTWYIIWKYLVYYMEIPGILYRNTWYIIWKYLVYYMEIPGILYGSIGYLFMSRISMSMFRFKYFANSNKMTILVDENAEIKYFRRSTSSSEFQIRFVFVIIKLDAKITAAEAVISRVTKSALFKFIAHESKYPKCV